MASYEHNYAGLGALLKSAQMQAMVRAKAERVESVAKADAPVGDTAEYSQSFEVEVGINDKGERARAVVRNTSGHSIYVEHGNGTEEFPGHRTLGRALDSA